MKKLNMTKEIRRALISSGMSEESVEACRRVIRRRSSAEGLHIFIYPAGTHPDAKRFGDINDAHDSKDGTRMTFIDSVHESAPMASVQIERAKWTLAEIVHMEDANSMRISAARALADIERIGAGEIG